MARQVLRPVRVNGFTGVNLRDEPAEFENGDLALAYNITSDLRGGVDSRRGYNKFYGSPLAGGALVGNVFVWTVVNFLFNQVGANLYKDVTLIHTFTTGARVGFADFAGKLCIVHPVDGFFTYDGATFTGPIAGGPKADSIAVWQNKLWTNDKSGTNPKSRVNFSAAGDPTSWPGTIDLREVSDAQIVNVFAGGDITGRPGLVAFKSNAAHHIYDSSTGAYQTIDAATGAASALSVVATAGRIIVLARRGIFETDGTTPLRKVSGKLDPLFAASTFASLANFCAGADVLGRVFFTMYSGLVGAVMIEYIPSIGWFGLNSNTATCYSAQTDGAMVFGSPSINGQVYTSPGLGDDDGASITAKLQTRWVELYGGMRARLNRARVNGRGVFTVSPLYNYDPATTALSRAVSLPLGAAGVHGGYQDILNLGAANSFAFYATATTNNSGFVPYTPRDLSDSGNAVKPVGSWGLHGIDVTDYVPLGRT